MHWQFHGSSKTLYIPGSSQNLQNLQILQHYRLTDFWSTGVVQFQSRGPPARARAREGRGGDTVVSRGGGACEIRCGGTAGRSCWGRGQVGCTVVQECRQLVGAGRACGVVGRRGHAHARMQKVELTSEQKVLILASIRLYGLDP